MWETSSIARFRLKMEVVAGFRLRNRVFWLGIERNTMSDQRD